MQTTQKHVAASKIVFTVAMSGNILCDQTRTPLQPKPSFALHMWQNADVAVAALISCPGLLVGKVNTKHRLHLSPVNTPEKTQALEGFSKYQRFPDNINPVQIGHMFNSF